MDRPSAQASKDAHDSDSTSDSAIAGGNDAIKIVIGMLNPAMAAETTSFMVDTSSQLCPEAMRSKLNAGASESKREHQFTILMTQVATAYAKGRGLDFANGRVAVHDLLLEDPQHQTLAVRFCKLMGLWIQAAWEEYCMWENAELDMMMVKVIEAEAREDMEMMMMALGSKDREMVMKALEDEDSEESSAEEDGEAMDFLDGTSSSGASVASEDSGSEDNGDEEEDEEEDSEEDDKEDKNESPFAARPRSIFDPLGLVETDENDSSSDGEGSSGGEDPSGDEDFPSDEE